MSQYVFHNNVLLKEYPDTVIPKFACPEGAYLFTGKHWYRKFRVYLVPINLGDIPKEVKTLCLLMGIQI